MKISELKDKMEDVDVEGSITFLEGPTTAVTKFGEKSRTYVVLSDSSGGIGLTLWGKDAERVALGDTVQIYSGFTSTWKNKQGEPKLQLNASSKQSIVRITKPASQSKLPEGEGKSSPQSTPFMHPSASGKGAPDYFEPEPKPSAKSAVNEELEKAQRQKHSAIITKIANTRIALQRAINEVDELDKLMGD